MGRCEVRERLRMEAADRLALGQAGAMIATELRVHVYSVRRWRKAWAGGGETGLASEGPASPPVLSDALKASAISAHGEQRSPHSRI